MTKMVYAEHSTVAGACGVGVVSEFTHEGPHNNWSYRKEITVGTVGGCGYLCAGFIKGDKICDDAFALLSGKYNVVYVSELRKNVNSKNEFYFVVFDCEGTGVPIGYDVFQNAGEEE